MAISKRVQEGRNSWNQTALNIIFKRSFFINMFQSLDEVPDCLIHLRLKNEIEGVISILISSETRMGLKKNTAVRVAWFVALSIGLAGVQ